MALIFVFLQVALALVASTSENTVEVRKSDTKPFPPTEPVSVDLNLITDQIIGVRLAWIPVTIGGTEFKLMFDTGSVFTWVMTDNVNPRKYKKNRKYPLVVPDSCEIIEPVFVDKTTIRGVWTNADVHVAGYERTQSQILGVTGILNDPAKLYSEAGLDGMFGAAAKPLKDSPEPWLFGTPFTVDINEAGKSMLTFGDTEYKSDITLAVDSRSSSYWGFDSSDLGITVFDTGAEVMLLPPSFIDKYMAKIKSWPPTDDNNEVGEWLVDCKQDMPDMEIDVRAGVIKIPGKDLREGYNKKDPEGRCRTRILEIPTNDDDEKSPALIGMPFFKSHVVTFDGPRNKIGITVRR